MSKIKDTKYPDAREDWLMIVEYAEKKSRFGCILCEKTHKIKDCPNRVSKISVEQQSKTRYDYEEEYPNPHNYGW